MGRKLAVSLVILLVFAAAGAAFVLLSGDDGGGDTAQGTTTTTVATSSTSTSLATTTTAPTTTTEPPTTTEPVPDACGIETGPISAAVNNGVSGASQRAQIDQCRFAASDPSWVSVHLVAKPGEQFAATTVLLQGGGGSWTIVGSGTEACAQAPQQVRADLGLICASGGGGI